MARSMDAEKSDSYHEHLEGSLKDASKDGINDSSETLSQWSAEQQKRIVRKIDVRLIPLCGIMYCVSLLDRTNLSNAAIAG